MPAGGSLSVHVSFFEIYGGRCQDLLNHRHDRFYERVELFLMLVMGELVRAEGGGDDAVGVWGGDVGGVAVGDGVSCSVNVSFFEICGGRCQDLLNKDTWSSVRGWR